MGISGNNVWSTPENAASLTQRGGFAYMELCAIFVKI
jgi:hypothetical protein